MSLKHSYTLIAPIYDALLAGATRASRRRSLAPLEACAPLQVLINGVGTGLDLPHLPQQHRYVGLDLTAAMLHRAVRREAGLHFRPVRGDAQRLPFADASFDAAVLHLILAVVPEPDRCLAETARVVKPGGAILVFDKFLRHGERGWWKRALNPLTRRIATRLDVVFEEVLAAADSLERLRDEPALAGGWFRLIELRKN
ncbi:demethylmenaquinone methyltransferase [mine drainage metagenome]|uniref:Demethylmenaquinone methyltransferase n=1 Tax=mine drainage metagenome TaxID=410659 RepID=A0A1J5S8E1_9ZZZZ